MSTTCRSKRNTTWWWSAAASAASPPLWFYRERHPAARILVIENHDDFGGHAKRNEFQAGGRTILGYGGSESLQSPNALYSEDAKHLLKRLGVELKRFETAFDTDFYPGLGLSRAVFFDKASFGVDKLVSGDPTPMVADEVPAIVSMPAPGAPSSATSH